MFETLTKVVQVNGEAIDKMKAGAEWIEVQKEDEVTDQYKDDN